MAGVQPATRRLLTEATGILAATRGAANGVATLDATGRLPAAQAPLTAVPTLAAKLADTVRVSQAALTADPDLGGPTLQPGSYLVELSASWLTAATATTLSWRLGGTATAAQVPSSGTLFSAQTASASTANVPQTLTATAVVTVTAAGTLGLLWGNSGTLGTLTMRAASWLRISRVA